MKFPTKQHMKTVTASGSNVLIVSRGEDGKRITWQFSYFKPYFCCLATEKARKDLLKRGFTYAERGTNEVKTFQDGPLGLDDKSTYKVIVNLPADVGRRRKGFEMTYEADVPYERRFLVDTGIKDGFIIHRARKVADDMFIVESAEDVEPVDYRNPDRQFLYDIETNKPEGSNHYSPPIYAKGAVTCKTLHDTFDGSNFHTFAWHPHRGVKGKPKLIVKNRFSRSFGRHVDWYVRLHGTEFEMFEALIAFYKERRPDVTSAWNGHLGWKKFMKKQGGFDMPYLINRSNNLFPSMGGHWSPFRNAFAGFMNFGKAAKKGDFECYVDGVQLVDSQTAYQVKDGGFTAAVPYSDLKRVVKDKLGYEMNKEIRKDIGEWWLNGFDEFLDYSFDDVDAIVGLEQKEGYTEWIRNIQQFMGTEDANRVFTPMSLISTINLRLAREKLNVVVPTAARETEGASDDDYSAEGGFVMPPQRMGLQQNMAVLDLSAMYVNIIKTCNMSWETWVPDPTDQQLKDLITVPSDLGVQSFVKPSKKVGLMPLSCDYLIQWRRKFDALIAKEKDADRAKALEKARDPAKQGVLAVFGTSLSEFFSLFRPEVGSSITGMGRHVITGVDRFLRDHGYFVQYSDTDSCFVPLKSTKAEDLEKEGKDLCDLINAWFTEMATDLGADQHSLEIGMDTILSPFVQGKQKKQYAGMVVYKKGHWQKTPKMLVKGVPGIKSDATRITKDTTDTVLRMILTRRPLMEVVEYIRDVYESVLAGAVPIEDIVKAVTLSTHPDDDLEKPNYIHTAAKRGQEMFDFPYSTGQKVSIVKLKGATKQKVAIPEGEDIPEGIPIDYDHHATRAVLKPLKGIMSWMEADSYLDSIRHGTELSRSLVLE
jgi:DNA polymerase elongation subunit (family B)